jgi:hypothetical protein
MKVVASQMLGCWELESTSPKTDFGERVQVQFDPEGRLIYGSLSADRWQVMFLTYRCDGDQLVTNQRSAPKEETTPFCVAADGSLRLTFAGTERAFKRVPRLAFELP